VHLFGQDDALGLRVLADDLENTPAIRLEHDQVSCGFRLEFIEHELGWPFHRRCEYMYSRLKG
jgi:hypothetical protein